MDSPFTAGNHRHAHVDLAAAGADRDAAILRQPALGDVEPGDQLDTAAERIEAVARVCLARVQHAVHAEADGERIRAGLEVDVRGVGIDSGREDGVSEFDDRRFLCEFAQPADVVARRGRGRCAAVLQGQEDAFKVPRNAERPRDARRVRERQADVLAQFRNERVAAGDLDRTVLAQERHGPMRLEPRQRGGRRVERSLDVLEASQRGVRVEQRQAQLLGERAVQGIFGQRTEADEDRAEALLELRLQAERRINVRSRNESLGDQQFAKAHSRLRLDYHGSAATLISRLTEYHLPSA